MSYDYNNGQGNNHGQENQQNQNRYDPYGNPYGTQGNPYGAQGNPYGTQGNPYGAPYNGFPPIFYQAGPDDNARSCHTMGLLSVIFLFISQILSIIFGALALSYAKKSYRALGYECPEMKSGRTMGKVGLIIGSILTGFMLLIYIVGFIILFSSGIV